MRSGASCKLRLVEHFVLGASNDSLPAGWCLLCHPPVDIPAVSSPAVLARQLGQLAARPRSPKYGRSLAACSQGVLGGPKSQCWVCMGPPWMHGFEFAGEVSFFICFFNRKERVGSQKMISTGLLQERVAKTQLTSTASCQTVLGRARPRG